MDFKIKSLAWSGIFLYLRSIHIQQVRKEENLGIDDTNIDELWQEYGKKRQEYEKAGDAMNQVLKKIAKILCACYHHDTDEWSWDYCSWRMSGQCPLFKQRVQFDKD